MFARFFFRNNSCIALGCLACIGLIYFFASLFKVYWVPDGFSFRPIDSGDKYEVHDERPKFETQSEKNFFYSFLGKDSKLFNSNNQNLDEDNSNSQNLDEDNSNSQNLDEDNSNDNSFEKVNDDIYKDKINTIENLNYTKNELKEFVKKYWDEMGDKFRSDEYQKLIRPIAMKKLEEQNEEKVKPLEIKDDGSIFAEPSGKKIALLTASNFVSAADSPIEDYESRVRENRGDYCNYHGYECIFLNISDFAITDRGPTWGKVSAIKYVLDNYPEVEWVWSLDADAVIMDPYISLGYHILSKYSLQKKMFYDMEYLVWAGKFISERSPREVDIDYDKIDLIIANDFNSLNTGSFFVRRSAFSEWLLDIWDDTDDKFWEEDALHEQFLLNSLLISSPYIQAHTAIVPQRLINAYVIPSMKGLRKFSRYKPGDFLVHLAGCRSENNCNVRFNKLWKRRKVISKEGSHENN